MTLETNAAAVRHDPPDVFYDHNGPENVAGRAAAWRGLRERCPVVHSSAYENPARLDSRPSEMVERL
ncbi:MAG: hypothetical protein QOJ80_78 [Mycobacterium sp.]|jgi:hypothetical protein|nr:hypothetical protein [Mycobacterium sp.]